MLFSFIIFSISLLLLHLRTSVMAANLRVEPAREEDIPRLMELVIPAFEFDPFSQLTGATNTPANRQAFGQHHLRSWREHATSFPRAPAMGVKCVHTDTTTGTETVVASAEWLIYDRPRTETEFHQNTYMLTGEWVADGATRAAIAALSQPRLDLRIKWFGSRPFALLLYMATDPAFQRRGAATQCVLWGLDRCRELSVPAYLVASAAGEPVYRRLGFETMGREPAPPDEDGEPRWYAVMIWWPPGTRDEDKTPACPDHGTRRE